MALAKIVDWSALGQVVIFSLALGVGVMIAFSLAIVGSTRFAEMRRDNRNGAAGGFALVAAVGIVVSFGTIALGIYELVRA